MYTWDFEKPLFIGINDKKLSDYRFEKVTKIFVSTEDPRDGTDKDDYVLPEWINNPDPILTGEPITVFIKNTSGFTITIETKNDCPVWYLIRLLYSKHTGIPLYEWNRLVFQGKLISENHNTTLQDHNITDESIILNTYVRRMS